jgi:predicted RNA-binding Zn ribbon-like protein
MSAYKIHLMQLAEDFINTYDTFLDEPEHLLIPADLDRFLQAHAIWTGILSDEMDLMRARAIRAHLREAWNADTPAEVMRILNPLLVLLSTQAELNYEESNTVVVEIHPQPAASLLEQLTVQAALGIAAAIERHGLDRLRACASEPCRDVYIDTSRNGSRRFCSDRCANRYNVAQYRGRQHNT